MVLAPNSGKPITFSGWCRINPTLNIKKILIPPLCGWWYVYPYHVSYHLPCKLVLKADKKVELKQIGTHSSINIVDNHTRDIPKSKSDWRQWAWFWELFVGFWLWDIKWFFDLMKSSWLSWVINHKDNFWEECKKCRSDRFLKLGKVTFVRNRVLLQKSRILIFSLLQLLAKMQESCYVLEFLVLSFPFSCTNSRFL